MFSKKKKIFDVLRPRFLALVDVVNYKPVLGVWFWDCFVLQQYQVSVCVILLCSLDSTHRWRDSARHVLMMLVRETVDARAACTSACRIGTMHARGASSSIVTVGISPVSELITSSTSHLPSPPWTSPLPPFLLYPLSFRPLRLGQGWWSSAGHCSGYSRGQHLINIISRVQK